MLAKPDEWESPLILSAPSALGGIAVAVSADGVLGITFGYPSDASARSALVRRLEPRMARQPRLSSQSDRSAVEELAEDLLDRLCRYSEGEPVDFSDVAVSVSHLSAFQRRVVKACRAIRRGERKSYGQLAAAAGSPGAARAVGQVMANNRTPLVVPCHRVVAAGGRLGGFSAPRGLAMKRRLLDLELADSAAMPSH